MNEADPLKPIDSITTTQLVDLDLANQLQVKIDGFSYCNIDNELWNYPSSKHPWTTLYLVLGGDGQVEHGAKVFPLERGRAYLWPKDLVLKLSCKSRVEKYWLVIYLEVFNGIDLLDGIDEFIDLGEADFFLSREFYDMQARMNVSDILELKSQCLRLMLRLGDRLNRQFLGLKNQFSKYHDLFDYIETHDFADLHLNQLAGIMKMTPQGLSRAFKRDIGMTIKAFLNLKIYKRACRSLSNPENKISAIAEELGFRDSYYFHRFFKKMHGDTPLAYRKSYSHFF